MNIANILTLIRIGAIPVMVLAFYLPFHWGHALAAFIFALAAFTDWLDGYVARTYQLTSPFGAFLDPVADKLIVAVALVILVGDKNLPYLAIPAAIIVGREIVISALREWMAEIGKRASIAVSFIGKVKTLLQMFAVVFLLAFNPEKHSWLGVLGYTLIYVAAILTIWSMIMYLNAAWPDLYFTKDETPK